MCVIVQVLLLSYTYNDSISETVLTLLFAYGVFFFAEYGLKMLR